VNGPSGGFLADGIDDALGDCQFVHHDPAYGLVTSPSSVALRAREYFLTMEG